MQSITGESDRQKLSAQGGWKHLKDDIELVSHEFTSLVWPLIKGVDPDDAFSSVPYEKGYSLLRFLEALVGEAAFLSFFHSYIQKFKFVTLTTGDFRDFFVSYFQEQKHVDMIKKLNWESLFLGTGMSSHAQENFSNSLSDASLKLANDVYIFDKSDKAVDIPVTPIMGWCTEQTTLFLDSLLDLLDKEGAVLKDSTLRHVDGLYQFTASNNSEIKFRWHMLCLKCKVEWIFAHVVSFITTQGRMKFVRPLYRALSGCTNTKDGIQCQLSKDDDDGPQLAAKTFRRYQLIYHPVARKMIARDLQGVLERYPATEEELSGGGCTESMVVSRTRSLSVAVKPRSNSTAVPVRSRSNSLSATAVIDQLMGTPHSDKGTARSRSNSLCASGLSDQQAGKPRSTSTVRSRSNSMCERLDRTVDHTPALPVVLIAMGAAVAAATTVAAMVIMRSKK